MSEALDTLATGGTPGARSAAGRGGMPDAARGAMAGDAVVAGGGGGLPDSLAGGLERLAAPFRPGRAARGD